MIELMTTVSTTRFGQVDVTPDQLLTFPDGLIGFTGHDYALLPAGLGPFTWLQSLADPELALPLTDPTRFFPAWALSLDDAERERLGDEPAAIEEVLVTVRAAPVAADCTANTRAPIVVMATPAGPRHAFQVLNRADGVELRAPLFGGG